MSNQEGEVLEAVTWLLRSLHERVSALEERYPTYASGYLPLADIAARLDQLDRAAIAAINGKAHGPNPGEPEAPRDPPQTAKPPAAGNAQPVAHGRALRAAIANVLETEPGATAPQVLERLRSAHAAGTLPSVRTVRWHLAHLRGNNGNGVAA